MIASSYILSDSLLRNILPYSVQSHASSATNTKYKESKFFYIHMSVHRNIIPNYSQQGELFYLFIFRDAVHVSGGSSAHHQEHTTVHTASGIVNQYCC